MSRLRIAPPPPPPEPVAEPELAPVEQALETREKEELDAEVVETRRSKPELKATARGRIQAAPPKLAQAPIQIHIPSEGFVDLNFKVEPELRQRFKLEAVRRGMSNKDLLAACFQIYLETFPSDEPMPTIKRPTAETMQRRREKRLEREKRLDKIRARQG